MIGVLASPSEHEIVREFFELFKTPWEFHRLHGRYEVVLCAQDIGMAELSNYAAGLVVIYSGRRLSLDENAGVESRKHGGEACILQCGEFRIPVYGEHLLFGDGPVRESPPCATHFSELAGRKMVRVGYDLFSEIRTLLTTGQPKSNAAIPTLDLHISLLRDMIIGSGVTLVEIPPVPNGYRFIACLTHDVDHPMIRRHKFDRTMFGFLYRATFGSILKAFRGRMAWRDVWRNSAAALKLPLVHLGRVKDYWCELDQYVAMEAGARSSFFVIPFAGRPGMTATGTAPSARAARYGAFDISSQIERLTFAGCEIGLHGIDAWVDSCKAKNELDEIRKIAGLQEVGVRMHWLYFDEHSPMVLEQAGASYDSTVGYNETIGYRAGTTQAYAPPGTSHLIELPLHVMDTALFFPGHLGLSSEEARTRVRQMIDNAVRFGGCLTVNWHDRSIAPERLWGEFYVSLVAELEAQGAWLATAGHAVSWFRKRRAANIENIRQQSGGLDGQIANQSPDDLPGLHLSVHRGRKQCQESSI